MADDQAPKDLMGFLDFYLVKKAPFQIPDAGREWIVKFGPWIAVVLMVFMLPAVLLVLGLGSLFMPFGGVGYAGGFGLAALFLLAQLGLMIAALPGLFARKMSGWKLLFYAQLVGAVYSILNAVTMFYGSAFGGILFALIGLTIGLYILFQVRTLYHD